MGWRRTTTCGLWLVACGWWLVVGGKRKTNDQGRRQKVESRKSKVEHYNGCIPPSRHRCRRLACRCACPCARRCVHGLRHHRCTTQQQHPSNAPAPVATASSQSPAAAPAPAVLAGPIPLPPRYVTGHLVYEITSLGTVQTLGDTTGHTDTITTTTTLTYDARWSGSDLRLDGQCRGERHCRIAFAPGSQPVGTSTGLIRRDDRFGVRCGGVLRQDH